LFIISIEKVRLQFINFKINLFSKNLKNIKDINKCIYTKISNFINCVPFLSQYTFTIGPLRETMPLLFKQEKKVIDGIKTTFIVKVIIKGG